MLNTTLEEIQHFTQALKQGPEAIYRRTIPAAVQGLQDEDSEIRGAAMELWEELFANGYGFKEAADLIKSGKIKETFDHDRLKTGMIQLFHQHGKEQLLQ